MHIIFKKNKEIRIFFFCLKIAKQFKFENTINLERERKKAIKLLTYRKFDIEHQKIKQEIAS